MASKSEVQTFTQSWDKTVAWARSQNIPFQAYYPVYQMDTQRMLTGYAMSEAERINAIQSAAGLTATTSLPGDNPNPANVPHNVVKNAQDIFTGLSPTGAGGGLIGNMFDTIRNTIEHPSTLYNAVEDFGKILNPLANKQQTHNALMAFDNAVLSPHNILSWAPGLYDVAMLETGKGRQLASQPLTALLDVLPMDRVLPQGLSRTEAGATMARRMGVTTDELAKMDGIQFGYRMAKTIPLGGLTDKMTFIRDAEGKVITRPDGTPGVRPMRIGERINLFRNQHGIGAPQGELLKGMLLKGDEGGQRLRAKLDTVMRALSPDSLSQEERNMVGHALQNDARPFQEKYDDYLLVNPKVANTLEVIHDYIQTDLELKLAAGDAVPVQVPFVQPDGTTIYRTEIYSLKPGSNGATVIRAKDAAEAAQTLLDTHAREFDTLAHKTLILDRQANNLFQYLDTQTSSVFSIIRNSEPSLAGIAHGIGESPQSILWERLPETQSPIVRNLLGMPKGLSEAALRHFPSLSQGAVRLTTHHANALRDLFAPGALIDQLIKAHKDMDWAAMSKYSRTIQEKFALNTFKDIPPDGPISKVKQTVDRLHEYALKREAAQNRMNVLMYGTKNPALIARGRFTPTSIAAYTKAAARAHDAFIRAAIDHPPDVWSNIRNERMTDQILMNEHSAEIVEQGVHYLSEHGFRESTLDQIRQDPRTLVELFVRASEDSYGNGMMPDIDVNLWKALEKNAYDEIYSLRAMGHAPEYIPMISPFDAERQMREGMNVYIRSIKPERTISSQLGRAFQFNSSVFNIAAGLLKDAKEQITKDVVREYFNQYVMPHLRSTQDMNNHLHAYLQEEYAHNALKRIETGVHETPTDALMRDRIAKMGYVTYDPKSLFGEGFSVPKLQGDYYIEADLADAIRQGVDKFQFPAEGVMDRGTKIFRFSILGLSPRYTAHILVGGSALVAYRGSPTMVRYIPQAVHAFMNGMFDPSRFKGRFKDPLAEKYMARSPRTFEAFPTSATMEGAEDRLFHHAAGYTVGNHAIREFMDNHQMVNNMSNWVKAAANINMRFTRAVVHAQRAMVYLDGAAKAQRAGTFTEITAEPMIDPATGQQVIDKITQRPQTTPVERQVKMTPDRAHHEGMESLHKTMGELRGMTPLERNVLARVFPFYGWTKHVLGYVLTYPIDHPYRTVFLSQLAEQDSENIKSGLPTRIQLLTLLGQPDPYGNVSALDTRAANPLRDTANYATLTGVLQSLNPVFSAPFAYVDPNIVFGGNELYPSLHYSQLYGTKQAGPQGNWATAAEQFVPELQGLDVALNLSGQYAYLKAQGGNGFQKKIYESLNVPFFQVQHINLRAMAAQNELDRFTQAKADALAAAQTGDMSTLSGYDPNAPIPDPLNPLYTVTPAYIAAMNAASERRFGLPMGATMASPPNPPL